MVQRTFSLTLRAASILTLAVTLSACEQYESAKSYTMDTMGWNDKPKTAPEPKDGTQALPAPTVPVTSSVTAPPLPEPDGVTIGDNTPLSAPSVSVPSKPENVSVEGRKPVLVIRFNQSHVYFDQAVANVVKAAESAKPGLTYDVVSFLPNLSKLSATQQADVNARANDNLKDVVMQIQQNGIPQSRIHVGTAEEQVTSQEIRVFVR